MKEHKYKTLYEIDDEINDMSNIKKKTCDRVPCKKLKKAVEREKVVSMRVAYTRMSHGWSFKDAVMTPLMPNQIIRKKKTNSEVNP